MIDWQTQKDAQSGAKLPPPPPPPHLPQLSQLSHDLSTKLSTSETQQSKLAAYQR